jgi:hypothetical protein
MNDELKAKLLGYLAKLETAAGKVGEFAETEIPETLKEYIRWTIVEGTVYTVVSAIPLILWLYYLPSLKREYAEAKGDEAKGGVALLGLGTLIGSCMLLFLAYVNYGSLAVKAYVAPRVVILEKLVSLTK